MAVLDLIATLTLDSSGYRKGLRESEQQANTFGSKLKSGLGAIAGIGAAALAATTTAVTTFGLASVKTGQTFDKSMSQVAATMGKTVEELENEVGHAATSFGEFEGNLREFAQYMGANTAFSASQAADALNYMALAGYNTQQSMDMLPNVLSLAAAGSMDLARASDMVTDTQTAFGISAERTTQMVDEMAKAASTGNTSVEQLGDAFLVVGGLAQELNGGMVTLSDGTQKSVDGIQEMEIALTAMANAGIKGSEAGTHMRNMIMKLSSPTDAGTIALQNMGIAIFDTSGNMRSLVDIFSDLNNALSGVSQEEKIQTISKLFNARDLASAEALLGAVSQDWDAIGESILNADGAAAKMAETQLDNLAGDITLFQSALEGVQIAISDKITPTFRSFVQMATSGLSEVQEALTKGDGWEGAADAIGNFLTNAVSEILNKVPTVVAAAGTILVSFAKGILTKSPEISDMLMKEAINLMSSLADGAKEGVKPFLENVLPMVVSFTGQLRENTGKLFDAGLDLLESLAQGIADGLPALIENVPQIVINIANIVNDNAPKILASGVKIIGTLILGIIKAIPTLIANLPKIAEAVFAVWSAISWINLGTSLVKFIGDGVAKLATAIPNALKNIGKSAIKFFTGINWAQAGTSIIQVLSTSILKLASMIPKALLSIGKMASNAFLSINWASVGINILKGIVKGITSYHSIIINAAINAAKSAFNAAKKFLGISSPSKLFRDQIGKMMALGLGEGFENNIPISDMVKSLDDAVGDMADIDIPEISPAIADTSRSTQSFYMPDKMPTLATGAGMGYNGAVGKEFFVPRVQQSESQAKAQTIIIEVSGDEFARAVYKFNNAETQRVGAKLATGGAV